MRTSIKLIGAGFVGVVALAGCSSQSTPAPTVTVTTTPTVSAPAAAAPAAPVAPAAPQNEAQGKALGKKYECNSPYAKQYDPVCK